MSSLTIIRGTPGAGKSSLAKKLRLCGNHAHHIEADMFFTDVNGVYVYDGMKIGEAHAWCQDTTEEILSNGGEVIVSNTFTTIKELMPYFAMAKIHGIVPIVYTCQNQFKDVHGVPEKILENMKRRFAWDISSLFTYLETDLTNDQI